MRCLPEVGSYHPSGLFLAIEEVREEVARSRVACFVSQSEDGTLLGDEYAERFEDSGDDVACGADVGLLLELADLEVFAEAFSGVAPSWRMRSAISSTDSAASSYIFSNWLCSVKN